MVGRADERKPLAAVDAAWLRMEHAANLMTITGVLTFDGPIDYARFKEIIEDRLLIHDRFRQKVVEPVAGMGRPAWVEDDHFSLKAHLHHVALPEPRDQRTLQEMVSDLMSTPLDRSRPLWQMHLIDDYEGGAAVVIRIHHCIADGIALIRLLFSLTDEEPDVPAVGVGGRPGATRRTARATMPEWILRQGMEMVLNPGRAMELAQQGMTGLDILRRLLALPPDERTVFHGALSVAKKAAWSAPIPLPEVKRIGKAFGATVNDVMLAAVSGALRHYMIARGELFRGKTLRAVVPVNLRPLDEALEFGNRFGLVFVDLPVGTHDASERLRLVQRRMAEIKASPEAGVVFGVLGLMGALGPELEKVAVSIFSSKATMVLTNVPGPQKQLYLAGAPVRNIMFWVPQSGGLGLGISIFSYAGNVRVGVAVDASLIPDPDTITHYLEREMHSLLSEAEGRAPVG